ncbi:hypothetical protein [Simkania negevensis]|uniref:Uncharacterized protein n=1 Tax=Simkania negevensis (strain ATCC VR-1471 / DSM 27360 / Z) TaxID=331113 RepID=F8L3A1_SIMNZ|nr:hypothetical protein [Simkania negevensis]CCB89739.1 putative uncharacterized protein [Simkania negevensis Z]
MKKIRLKNLEYDYLLKSIFLSNKIKEEIKKSTYHFNTEIYIELNDDLIDSIRDECGEHLQIVGFDKDYKITKEGELLESLIDKFYLG